MNESCLGKILELEDYSSLSRIKGKLKETIDCEIVEYIKETKDFSAVGLSSISMMHSLRYIELCNLYRDNEIKMENMKYVVRLQQKEDFLDG